MKRKGLPKFLQSALWSYDLGEMDVRNPGDKDIIITQILNHGTWEQLKWLLNTYSRGDIAVVLKNPRRGTWNRDSLDYWLTILNLNLPKEKYQMALFDLNPKSYVPRGS